MPKIEQTPKGGRIIFDSRDWLAGLNPQYTASTALRQKIGDGLGAARAFDPYRDLGYASPSFNPLDLTNVSVIDAVQKNCVVNGALAYSVGGTKVHQITLATSTITTPTTFPHAVASSVMEDVIVYKIGTTSYLFYSWYDGTDGDIGRYDFATTFDDDFMSTVPAGAAVLAKSNPIPMIVGIDDVLYTADGNSVHAFDGQTGANGTLSKNVLVLPTEYKITGFARYGQQLAVFATTSGDAFFLSKSTVFFWNYLDLDPSKIVQLDDNYVSAPFEWKGTIGCFTQGRSIDKANSTRYCKLRIYDGAIFKTVANIIGNVPAIGGVDIVGDIIYANIGGQVYSWGSPFLEISDKLNFIAEGSGSTAGFLKSLTTSLQLISSGTTTSGGMQSLNTNYNFQSFVATAFAKPLWPIGKKGRTTTIIVKYARISTGGRGITLTLKDRLENLIGTLETNLEEITSTTYVKKYEDISTAFDDIKLIVAWSVGSGATDAPILDSVEVEFEYINV